ncbi:MAG: hypothetical protein HC918_08730 [Oscillatoriales cyanobacterium SM2_1_8]|nr:hypothetical protein [Oscillatoriales cyanobacterium SM2_1_8]
MESRSKVQNQEKVQEREPRKSTTPKPVIVKAGDRVGGTALRERTEERASVRLEGPFTGDRRSRATVRP